MKTAILGKSCVACGKSFIPRRSDAITCSNKCRVAAFRKGRSVTVIRPVSIIPDDDVTDTSPKVVFHHLCAQCGAGIFTDPPSDEPTIRVISGDRVVWMHPECRVYRRRYGASSRYT